VKLFLEVYAPSGVGRRVDVPDGVVVRVGSAADAEIVIEGDVWLAPWHVAFWCDAQGLHVRDLDTPHGIYVNEQGSRYATLQDGDNVQAGTTYIMVRHDRGADALVTQADAHQDANVLSLLKCETSTLYAIVDAARDDMVLPWLLESGAQHVSLYDGWQASELADVAPYLVAVSKDSAVLSDLLSRSWGQAWGVFLSSSATLRDLRRHLRRFLKVQVEGQGRMLFRFYDPRVLRAYLPTCTLEEANAFFGPVDCFLVEGHTGESLQRFHVTPDGVASTLQTITS
jgi:Domain of unknown function (DUF4123)/FHA domain